MLGQMRQAAKGGVSKVLMLLLVLSFAVWGVGSFQGYGAGELARVGDQEVTVPEFARAYQQSQSNAQASGQQVDAQQVLNRVLLNAAIDDAASGYNMGISDAKVAQQIAADPNFQGPGGTFDRQRFDILLQNAGIRRDDFVTDVRAQAVRNQVAGAVIAGVAVPQPLVEALYRFQNEERAISYLVIDPTATTPVGTPSDSELQTYFDANKDKFRAPEYRKLTLLVLDAAALADTDAVSDADVEAEYQRRLPDLTRPERRRIEQLRFDTAENAQAAFDAVQAGQDLSAAAGAAGASGGVVDLGLKTPAEILDPAVAEAAFKAQPDTIVPVLESTLGPSLVRVTTVEPGSVTPLEEIAPRIRQDLATRQARDSVQDIYDKIEDERAGGATLEEVAKSVSLPSRTVDVASDGTAPDGSRVPDLPAQAQLLKEAFESDVGVENSPIRDVAGGRSVFFDVVDITPSRDRTLDEARDAVVAAWEADQRQTKVTETADALFARLKAGESMAALGAEIGKPVQTAEGVKRGTPPAGLSVNALAQAFAGPQGHVANADGDTPESRILLKVDRVTAPAFFAEATDAQAIRTQLASAMQNDIFGTFNRELLQNRETTVNQAAFAQLTGTARTP